MQKLTKVMYDSYRSSLEKTIAKSQHNLLTRMIPVSCVVAREIGMKLDPKVVSAMKDLPPNESDPLTVVKLIDYAEAMEAYGEKRWGVKPIEDGDLPVAEMKVDAAEPPTKPDLRVMPELTEKEDTNSK